MPKQSVLLVVLFSAILITILFHSHTPGLNLVLFETLMFGWMLITKQLQIRGKYPITISSGVVITLASTLFTYSLFSYVIHFLVLLVFVGSLIYPEAKSLLTLTGIAFTNLLRSQLAFLKKLSNSKLRGRKLGSHLWKLRIFLIPILVIFLFVVIYRNSNPVFDELVADAGRFLQEKVWVIFVDFDFLIIVTFLIGLLLSNFLFIRIPNQRLSVNDARSVELLGRIRRGGHRRFRMNALANEYKAGVFLLLVLNMVILILNVIDVKSVWFAFEWEGQFLKQFVHEGTWLLILSILISIVIVLYFFRGNLNFYGKNRLLKSLSFIWLAQNGILTLSVAIRNFHYINYFALAYKRIGVIVFLILTIFGLFTVFLKVKQKRSAFYLFRTNAYAWFLVLILSAVPNWDRLIAKYNFSHSDSAFLHLEYMATLSDNSLPDLDKSLDELGEIEQVQKEIFHFEMALMAPEVYDDTIERRKAAFRKKWESKSFLSWNYPESRAYKALLQAE